MKVFKVFVVFGLLFILTGCPPVRVPEQHEDYVAVLKDEMVTIYVLLNDATDNEKDLKLEIVSKPSHGNAYLNTKDSFNYHPEKGFVGVDSFTYVAYDHKKFKPEPTTVTIIVKETNSDPIANHDDVVLTDDSKVVGINVLENDSDDDHLTILRVSAAPHGIVRLEYDGIKYIPRQGYRGEDMFSYVITDGIKEVEANVFITIKDPEQTE